MTENDLERETASERARQSAGTGARARKAGSALRTPVSRRNVCGAALGLAAAGLVGGLAGCTGAGADAGSGSAPAGSSAGSASSGAATSADVAVRIGALKGPTGMGLIQIVSNPEAYGCEVTLAGAADELTPQLIQGDLDVLCVPANLAATLYQKTEGALTVLCVNTLGVLDIVEAGDTIQSIADLAGRTIYSAGRGSTPQYALEYLLRQNGVDPATDVTIEWVSEHAECLAALEADPSIVCMLPQPFATSALSKVEGARIALDLSQVWDQTAEATGDTSQLVTGVAVARREFVDEHEDVVEELLGAYENSVAFVNDSPAEAAKLIEEADIVPATVAEKAIPYCNIVFMIGSEMKNALEGYLQTLYDADAASVGGAMPQDDFYYGA